MYFCALLHGHVRVPVWHTNLCSPFILSNETGICEMELTFQKLWLSYLPLIPQVLWPTSIEYETVSKFWESHVPKSLISFCCSGKHIDEIRQLSLGLTAHIVSAFSQHTIFLESRMKRDFEIITFSQHFVEWMSRDVKTVPLQTINHNMPWTNMNR